MSATILAAGAVLWRKGEKKKIEVLIIHRPKYDDWTFPKGKAEIGEPLIACAYREVLEETNIETAFGPYLGEVEYLTNDGKKKVSFWSAKVIKEKEFNPNAEVDQLKWVEVTKVKELLTLNTDKKILEQFLQIEPETKPLILLRHAKAVTRDEWQGEDDDRPLDSYGQNQAKRLLAMYQVFNLEQIHSSDAVRCYDTVVAIAKSLSIKLEVTGKLSESTFKKDKEKAFDYAKDLMKLNESILLCSHNPILPKMLNKLTKKSEVDADEGKLLPADGWVIHRIGKEVIQIDRIDSPSI
jgi:8-oxo-dGTP diphosphatase